MDAPSSRCRPRNGTGERERQLCTSARPFLSVHHTGERHTCDIMQVTPQVDSRIQIKTKRCLWLYFCPFLAVLFKSVQQHGVVVLFLHFKLYHFLSVRSDSSLLKVSRQNMVFLPISLEKKKQKQRSLSLDKTGGQARGIFVKSNNISLVFKTLITRNEHSPDVIIRVLVMNQSQSEIQSQSHQQTL